MNKEDKIAKRNRAYRNKGMNYIKNYAKEKDLEEYQKEIEKKFKELENDRK